MSIYDDLRAAIGRIESALTEYPAGWDNQEAKRVIERELRFISANVSIQAEKISSLQGWIDILYSPRKWQRYVSLEQVDLYARHDCSSLNSIVDQLERAAEKEALTWRELEAIRAAVSAGKVGDLWGPPVHAIDRALGITSAESRDLLKSLMDRGMIEPHTQAQDAAEKSAALPTPAWWEAARGVEV